MAMQAAQGLILIIDDDAGIREVLRNLLVRSGYLVALAENGAQAQQELQRRTPDLVILDLILGEENGWEVLRVLRQGHQMPVLMSTGGSVDDQVRDNARALGAQGVLEKPFTRDQLLGAVEKLLP